MNTLNTWPGGHRRALTQSEHERWNATRFPGTLQLCIRCNEPTERCEEDSMYVEDVGPLCKPCFAELDG